MAWIEYRYRVQKDLLNCSSSEEINNIIHETEDYLSQNEVSEMGKRIFWSQIIYIVRKKKRILEMQSENPSMQITNLVEQAIVMHMESAQNTKKK